jgi:hypothetical protein
MSIKKKLFNGKRSKKSNGGRPLGTKSQRQPGNSPANEPAAAVAAPNARRARDPSHTTNSTRPAHTHPHGPAAPHIARTGRADARRVVNHSTAQAAPPPTGVYDILEEPEAQAELQDANLAVAKQTVLTNVEKPLFSFSKHQTDAIKRMVKNINSTDPKHGIVLSHEMGSGKTITVLATIANLPYFDDKNNEIKRVIFTPRGLEQPWLDDMKLLKMRESKSMYYGIEKNKVDRTEKKEITTSNQFSKEFQKKWAEKYTPRDTSLADSYPHNLRFRERNDEQQISWERNWHKFNKETLVKANDFCGNDVCYPKEFPYFYYYNHFVENDDPNMFDNFKNSIIVFDEAHNIIKFVQKLYASPFPEVRNRAVRLLNALNSAKYLILLTGTPVESSVSEFKYLINIAAGKEIIPKTEFDFIVKYTNFELKSFDITRQQYERSLQGFVLNNAIPGTLRILVRSVYWVVTTVINVSYSILKGIINSFYEYMDAVKTGGFVSGSWNYAVGHKTQALLFCILVFGTILQLIGIPVLPAITTAAGKLYYGITGLALTALEIGYKVINFDWTDAFLFAAAKVLPATWMASISEAILFVSHYLAKYKALGAGLSYFGKVKNLFDTFWVEFFNLTTGVYFSGLLHSYYFKVTIQWLVYIFVALVSGRLSFGPLIKYYGYDQIEILKSQEEFKNNMKILIDDIKPYISYYNYTLYNSDTNLQKQSFLALRKFPAVCIASNRDCTVLDEGPGKFKRKLNSFANYFRKKVAKVKFQDDDWYKDRIGTGNTEGEGTIDSKYWFSTFQLYIASLTIFKNQTNTNIQQMIGTTSNIINFELEDYTSLLSNEMSQEQLNQFGQRLGNLESDSLYFRVNRSMLELSYLEETYEDYNQIINAMHFRENYDYGIFNVIESINYRTYTKLEIMKCSIMHSVIIGMTKLSKFGNEIQQQKMFTIIKEILDTFTTETSLSVQIKSREFYRNILAKLVEISRGNFRDDSLELYFTIERQRHYTEKKTTTEATSVNNAFNNEIRQNSILHMLNDSFVDFNKAFTEINSKDNFYKESPDDYKLFYCQTDEKVLRSNPYPEFKTIEKKLDYICVDSLELFINDDFEYYSEMNYNKIKVYYPLPKVTYLLSLKNTVKNFWLPGKNDDGSIRIQEHPKQSLLRLLLRKPEAPKEPSRKELIEERIAELSKDQAFIGINLSVNMVFLPLTQDELQTYIKNCEKEIDFFISEINKVLNFNYLYDTHKTIIKSLYAKLAIFLQHFELNAKNSIQSSLFELLCNKKDFMDTLLTFETKKGPSDLNNSELQDWIWNNIDIQKTISIKNCAKGIELLTSKRGNFPNGQGDMGPLSDKLNDIFKRMMKQKHLCSSTYSGTIGIYDDISKRQNELSGVLKVLGITISDQFKSIFQKESKIGDKELFLVNCLEQYFAANTIINIFTNKIFECEKFKKCVEGTFDKKAEIRYTESLIKDTLYCNYLPVVYSNYYEQGYKEFSAYLTNRELCHIPIDVNDEFSTRSYLQTMASTVSYPLVEIPVTQITLRDGTISDLTYPDSAPIKMKKQHDILDNFVDRFECQFAETDVSTYHTTDVYQYMPIVKDFTTDNEHQIGKINLKNKVLCPIEELFYNSKYILRDGQYLKMNRPICVVLHPELIEGVSFPMSPNMHVLEVPEGFGKRDQIYARILRFISDSEPTILRKKENDFIKNILCDYTKSDQWGQVDNCPKPDANSTRSLFDADQENYGCDHQEGQVVKQTILDEFKTKGMKEAIDLLLRQSKCEIANEDPNHRPKLGSNQAKERGIMKTLRENICKSAVYLCDTQKRFLISYFKNRDLSGNIETIELGERINEAMDTFIDLVKGAGSGNLPNQIKHLIKKYNLKSSFEEYKKAQAYYGFLLEYDEKYHSNIISQDLIIPRTSNNLPTIEDKTNGEAIKIIINTESIDARYHDSEYNARKYLLSLTESRGKSYAVFERLISDSENFYLTLLEYDKSHEWVWQMKKQIIQYSRTTNGDIMDLTPPESFQEGFSWLCKDWSFLERPLPWEIEQDRMIMVFQFGEKGRDPGIIRDYPITSSLFIENKINADMKLNKMLRAIYYKDARNRSTFNKVKGTINEIKLATLISDFNNVKILFDGYDLLLSRKNNKNEKIYKKVRKQLETINDGVLSDKMIWKNDPKLGSNECSRLNFQTDLSDNLSWTSPGSSCILRKIQSGGNGINTFIYHPNKDKRIRNWQNWYNDSQEEGDAGRLIDNLSEELVFEMMISYTLNSLKQSIINFSIENSVAKGTGQSEKYANEHLKKWIDDPTGKEFYDYIVRSSDLKKLIGIKNFTIREEDMTFTEKEFQDICADTLKEVITIISKENRKIYKLHRDYFTIGIPGALEELEINIIELPEIAYYRECYLQKKIFKKFVAKNEIPVLIDVNVGTIWGINTKKYFEKTKEKIINESGIYRGKEHGPTNKTIVEEFVNKSKIIIDIIYPDKIKYQKEFIEEQAELGNYEYNITHTPELYIDTKKETFNKVFNLDKKLYKIGKLDDIDSTTHKLKTVNKIDGYQLQVLDNEFINDKPIGVLNGTSIVLSDSYIKELIIDDIYLETMQIILSKSELRKLVETREGMLTLEQTLNTMIQKYTEMSVDELTNIPNELKQDKDNFWVVYANKQELALLESNGLCIPIKDCVSGEDCSEKEKKRRERQKMKDVLKRKYQEYKPGAMPIKSKMELEREALEFKQVQEEEKEAFLRWGQHLPIKQKNTEERPHGDTTEKQRSIEVPSDKDNGWNLVKRKVKSSDK